MHTGLALRHTNFLPRLLDHLQVGDIESGPFLEALRQFVFRVGRENICIIFVTFVPVLSGEQKSKPTQAGVKGERQSGWQKAVSMPPSHLPPAPVTRQICERWA